MSLSFLPVRRPRARGLSGRLATFALVLIPLCAIAAVVLWTTQSSSTHAPAGPAGCTGGTTPCLPGAGAPCCLRWQQTALTAEVDALVRDPLQPGRFMAGTSAGLWISADAGRTWHVDRTWPANNAILAFAGDPSTGALFAGAADGRVYLRSSGPAGPWQPISPALGGQPIFSLAAHTAHGLLAGTVGGLYRGAQQGGRWGWQRVAQTGDSAVTSIIWDPSDARRAYASVFGTWPPVLHSVDGGRTWQADTRGLSTPLPTESLLALDRADVLLTTMGGGVWLRGADGRWQDIAAGLPERHAMAVVAAGSGALYAGTMGSGVYERRGGEPWHRLGHGLEAGAQYTVLSLAAVGGPQPYLLAGTAQGLFRYPLSG